MNEVFKCRYCGGEVALHVPNIMQGSDKVVWECENLRSMTILCNPYKKGIAGLERL